MYKYGHRTRGHPKLQKLLAFVFALVMLVTMVPADLAKADAIEHTHIWATTYDSTNHWEYCTVCGEKRNVTAHVFTDHWNNGKESCFWANYDTKTCECGYSYIYRKPHDPAKLSGWINVKSSHSHHIECKDCGTWIQATSCRDSNGKILGCNNPGTCVTCGAVYTADEHKLTNGKCDYCDKQIAIYSTPEVTYSDDREYAYIKEKITPVDTDAILQGLWWACSDANGYFVGNYSIVDDADGVSKDYSWTYKFTDYQRFSTWSLACTYIINGTSVHNDYPSFNIWYDHEAPVINEIKQTDQASFNGYATIKQLDVTGTDNASKYVDINITDKITGKNMMEKATVNVVNGKWAYTCTPPLEADDNGRTYTLTAIDKIGNSSTQDFTIYKTDGTAPQVESPLSYTDWTNKAKTVTLTVTDYGSGAPQASLGDQVHYQACIKTTDGKYQVTYTFSDDIIGTKDYKLYLKDALGNATSCTLTVGNIDKNAYNISYNLNGGSLSGQKTSYTVVDSFTLPQPTKTGYTFIGWTGSNGTTPQKTVTINKDTRGNLSYTANWSANQYSVTYNANGGTGTMSVDTATYNENYVTKTNQFTRIGYEFVGWTENADGTGTNWTTQIGKPLKWTYTKNITLHAQWKAKTYTNILKHWAYGMKYGEGNNGYKNYFLIGDTPYTKSYGETYVMDDSWLIKIPNGYYSTRCTGFFTFASDGTTNGFVTRGFGYKFVQNDNNSYESLYHELYYRPYDYTITYNLNGGTNNSANPSTYNVLYGVSLKAPTRTGYTFTGWYDENDNKVTGINEGCNATFSSADDLYAKLAARTTGNRVLTAHWSYNPVSVKVPQILIGDHTGKSQFRVKCDDFKAGNIKITVPDSFSYKQEGKTDVTATITSKSGNNTITPTNKVCVYDITTKNGLTAGCWSGSFDIGLTLTKE